MPIAPPGYVYTPDSIVESENIGSSTILNPERLNDKDIDDPPGVISVFVTSLVSQIQVALAATWASRVVDPGDQFELAIKFQSKVLLHNPPIDIAWTLINYSLNGGSTYTILHQFLFGSGGGEGSDSGIITLGAKFSGSDLDVANLDRVKVRCFARGEASGGNDTHVQIFFYETWIIDSEGGTITSFI